jgi:hypothetical protein
MHIRRQHFVVSSSVAVSSATSYNAIADSAHASDTLASRALPPNVVIRRIVGRLSSMAGTAGAVATGVTLTLGTGSTAANFRSYSPAQTLSLQTDGSGSPSQYAYFEVALELHHHKHNVGDLDSFKVALTGGTLPTANLQLFTHYELVG